jgi:hypothetical protein
MRRALALALPLTSVLTFAAAPALALGLCDPRGHLCVQIDSASATVCDLTRLGGLDRRTCTAQDATLRDDLRTGKWPPFAAFVLRFDGGAMLVMASKQPARSELTEGELAAHAATIRAGVETTTKVDSFAPPRLERVHDVQVVRFDSQWTAKGQAMEELDAEVLANDAAYMVSFQGPAGQPLAALAESAMATLDALPASRGAGPGEAIKWGLRGLFAALVITAGMVWLGRRKSGMASRDLWPR